MTKNIFERDLDGEVVSASDQDYDKILWTINNAQKLTSSLNNRHHSKNKVNKIVSKITGKPINKSVWLMPPFYTDFGKNIVLGKNVFINHGCTFMDRGGITIGDDVLIAPKVNLITTNHPIDAAKRKATISKPIILEKNVWVGIGATIMPGVTIGENSIVAASSVVAKNVPANVIVAGIPAKIIKRLK